MYLSNFEIQIFCHFLPFKREMIVLYSPVHDVHPSLLAGGLIDGENALGELPEASEASAGLAQGTLI